MAELKKRLYRWLVLYAIVDGVVAPAGIELRGRIMDKTKAVCYHDDSGWHIVTQSDFFSNEDFTTCMNDFLSNSWLVDEFPDELLPYVEEIETNGQSLALSSAPDPQAESV